MCLSPVKILGVYKIVNNTSTPYFYSILLLHTSTPGFQGRKCGSMFDA